ncbi:MAG: hypothetical protein NDP13_02395 [Crenarchaeota archaeon]|nr:hypothetical protein [Thermoproteota archaeon]MCR8455628.1 hypothetical protein [Thermoproteota archaeon]MCR8462630.1 hypothetical protein [Thermoproteota archaeon]MCR8470939.1 hypothetical protein [Thermoproteota archaeon]MCR8471775.1 hypothetical protein [Thermoproteota archaeon]
MLRNESYYLLAFELDSPRDLCNVIYYDFLLSPSPKVLLKERRKILYFASRILRGKAGNCVGFCFFVITPNEMSKDYLICSEDRGLISDVPDPKAPACFEIFNVEGLLRAPGSEIAINDPWIRQWSFVIKADENIITHITSKRGRILLAPKSGNYLIIISKNSLTISYLEESATYKLKSLSPAIFRCIMLYKLRDV